MSADVWRQMGLSGLRRVGGFVTEEWLPRLAGPAFARAVRELIDNSTVIAGYLWGRETLIRQARWKIVRPNDTAPARQFEEHANECLDDMDRPWSTVLSEALSMGPFGWAVLEVVMKLRRGRDTADPSLRSKYSDGKVGWRKIAIRAQESLWRWEFNDAGDPIGMWQMAAPDYRPRYIDLRRAVLFRPRSAKDNPEGRSLLRAPLIDWYYLKRHRETEAIGIQRDMAGTMVARVPPQILSRDASDEEKAILETVKQIVTRADANEYQGFVFPASKINGLETGWEIGLMTSGGRRAIDTDAIIKRIDTRMLIAVLANARIEGADTHGSYALSDNHVNIEALSYAAEMDAICDDFTAGPIALLGELTGTPPDCWGRLEHGDIEMPDLTQMAAYVSQLMNSGAIEADPALLAFVRRYARIPMPELSSKVEVEEEPDDAGAPAEDGEAEDD